MQVWTASHIDVPERWESLKECVNSVRKFNLPHYISISFEPGLSFNIIEITDKNLNVLIQPTKISQMEHIRILDTHVPHSDYIMFMDDDDVLDSLPEVRTQIGHQYHTSKLNYFGEMNTLYEPYDAQMDCFDFSGTICTRAYLEEFWEALDRYPVKRTGDLLLMAMLDKKYLHEKPYVFRRFWNPTRYKHAY